VSDEAGQRPPHGLESAQPVAIPNEVTAQLAVTPPDETTALTVSVAMTALRARAWVAGVRSRTAPQVWSVRDGQQDALAGAGVDAVVGLCYLLEG
jgi:hypothetical protein